MSQKLDLLITGGRIVDGTGGPSYLACVGVRDGKIVLPIDDNADATTVLDATNCIVSPGFIDAHSNLSWGLLIDRSCRILSFQGVTTAVTGNCGSSVFPVIGASAAWIKNAALDYSVKPTWKGLTAFANSFSAIGVDIVPLVGHGTLRAAIVGFQGESLDAPQLVKLRRLLRKSFKEGAWGVSFGLAYAPGIFADRRELVACCEEASDAERVCCFHLRIESDKVEEAVLEIVELAKESKARCIICHHKALGRANWGKISSTLSIVDEANALGCEIFFDSYPYTTAFRNLASLLPDWAHDGGRTKLLERLRDRKQLNRLVAALRMNARRWDAAWEDTIITSAPVTPELEGLQASEVISDVGEVGLLYLLLKNRGRLMMSYEGATFSDLQNVALHPRTVVGSDGNAQHPAERGHPRSFATFPRFLFAFVETEAQSLESGIRKMTGLPAHIFRLDDRGLIRNKLRADLCVFSLEKNETFANASESLHSPFPRHLVTGGRLMVKERSFLGESPGRIVLRRS